MVEAYVVETALDLNIAPALGGLGEYIKALRMVLDAQGAIKDAMAGIVAAQRDLQAPAAAYAASMAKAAASWQAIAAAQNGVAASGFVPPRMPAGPGAPPVVPPDIVPPRLLAGPGAPPVIQADMLPPGQQPQNFQLIGPAFNPQSRDLVPTGAGRTNTETTGRVSPDTGGTAVGPFGPRGGDVSGRQGAGRAFDQIDLTQKPNANPSPEPLPFFSKNIHSLLKGYLGFEAGEFALHSVASSWDAASAAGGIEGLGQMQFTQAQVLAARHAAEQTQAKVLGTYVGDNLKLIAILKGLTQDADASIAAMPEVAKAADIFKALGRDGNAEIVATLQSAEMRGILFHKVNGKEEFDYAALQKWLDSMVAIATMSDGKYAPIDIMKMLRSAGVAGAIMTDEHGMAEYMPLIQSLGAARGGTAIRGFSQQFSAGKMSSAGFEMLKEMGIIQHPDLVRKLGMGQYQLKPGAMGFGDFQQATQDPVGFVEQRLLPHVDEWLKKQYGDKFTTADPTTRAGMESATMQQLASRIPGGVFDSEITRLMPLILRDITAAKQQIGTDPYNTLVANNDKMQLEGVQAAWNAFLVSAGDAQMPAAIEGLKDLTAGLNDLKAVLAWFHGAPPNVPGLNPKPAPPPGPNVLDDALGFGVGGLVGKFLAGARFGTAGLAGMATKWTVDTIDPRDKMDYWADRIIPGWEWLDRKLNHAAGVSDKDFDRARGLNQPQQPIQINLNATFNVDGKKMAAVVTSHMANAVDGPLNGQGSFDQRMGYTTTEH